MIKVITMVGTSIIDNYLKENRDIQTSYSNIKDKSYSEYKEYKNQAEKVKRAIVNSYSNDYTADISAEIKSINKIKACLKDNLQIFLLASDTIASYIVAEILEEILIRENFEVFFNPKSDVLGGLQVQDRDLFINEGLPNLIHRIARIATGHSDGLITVSELGNSREYYNNVVFNISGGYKVCIPYLTVMAQINGCDMYYIFENTEELITTPSVPIITDVNLFEKYSKEFMELEQGVDGYSKWRQENYNFTVQASSCIQVVDDIAMLSPLGYILWADYKIKYVTFLATDKVIRKMKSNKILIEKVLKFMDKDIRKRKTEIKGSGRVKHYVYDDGDNVYRVFYLEKGDVIFIYEIFDSEEKQIDYLNSQTESSRYYNSTILCSINRKTKELTQHGDSNLNISFCRFLGQYRSWQF